MSITIAMLAERIDLLAYHLAVLEHENAALRARADAIADRELRAAAPPKLAPAPTPIRRTDWTALGPVVRRRIA